MIKMFKQITTVSAFMISAFTFSQVGIETENPQATLDVVGKPADNSVLDGIIAPRIEGAQLRAKTYTSSQTGALVYVTVADTAPAGQTIDVTAAGYYYFNGVKWVLAGAGNMVNIYNANGGLTSNRTLTLSGFPLNFTGAQQRSNWNANGLFTVNNLQTTGGEASMGFVGGNNSNVYIQQFRGGTAQMIANGNNTELIIGTGYTTPPSGVRFDTSPGGGVMGSARMYITPIGNVKIGASDEGTEKLDVEGIARVRELPLNGAANAHNTLPDGTLSPTQNQTFTATKTVVADGNGVLGYVNGIPSDAGTSKVVVIANAPGTQNVRAQSNPNAAIGQFTNESLDVYNAWTNNVFTVPTGLGGIYIIVMQNSSTHTSTGTATPTWHTMAYYERSTNGGANWTTMIKHTYADLAGTIVDNGNTLYWTGFLNAGDMIRVRFSCNATTDNIVNYGGLSITKLAQ